MNAPYRLGLDVGTNSLGWCALRLDPVGEPVGILDLGARIFADGRDPQKGTSLAVDRRLARQARRRRDRFVRRRDDLMDALVRHGLMPADAVARKALEALDPYALRARGLDEELPPHAFGRALFHLHQRRGFRSIRQAADRGKDKEAGKISAAIEKLTADMAASGARTLGEHMHRLREAGDPVRARLRGEGAKAAYDLYPQRAMVEAEFDLLWARQAAAKPAALTPEAGAAIRAVMFRQRPLKPVEPGRCRYLPEEPRAPWALPAAQTFRILQDVGNLRIELPDRSFRRLTREEAARLHAELERRADLTFERIRRLLGLGSDARFNFEEGGRDRLPGHRTNHVLAGKALFGARWWTLTKEQRTGVVELLLSEPDDERLIETLRTDWGLSEEAARRVADAPIPEGHARLGRTALAILGRIMRDEPDPENPSHPIRYDQAVARAGRHHSDDRTGEILDALPYYGPVLEPHLIGGSGIPDDPDEARYGRIPNPTVHIGLNQLRRLVNAAIAAYGPPQQIVVELARELKQSREQKDRIAADQAERRKENERRRAMLVELGLPDNGDTLLRLRLWEELAPEPHARRCVYTGEPISIRMLFDGSLVAIDHILPFRASFDDGAANKIVCLARANVRKGKRSPFEAFGHTAEWEDILRRAETLPRNKRWRFAPDAMDRLRLAGAGGAGSGGPVLPADAAADLEEGTGFLARHLTDTQYLARLTREYLGHVCDPSQVYAIPGRLTEMLRRRWGLNKLLSDSDSKNRTDHRHHAIDACVIALTRRSLLQQVAAAAEHDRERMLDDLPEPWDGFRDELRDKVRAAVVSLRPDHGAGGKLHEETAYGLVADPDAEGGNNIVYRKPFAGLNENEIARIRDRRLRTLVQEHVAAATTAAGGGKLPPAALKQALAAFAAVAPEEYRGLARVRLLKTEEAPIPIRDRASGRVYKAVSPGANHHIAIFEQPDGGAWVPELVTMFDANRPKPPPRRRAHPAARLVMRLHKGDLIKVEPKSGEEERIMRVVRLGASKLYLAAHHETGDLQRRHDDPDDPFRWCFVGLGQLKARRARKVSVDMLGRVRDPGPPA
jgi:CRISPR-associated endonuclease Csn1